MEGGSHAPITRDTEGSSPQHSCHLHSLVTESSHPHRPEGSTHPKHSRHAHPRRSPRGSLHGSQAGVDLEDGIPMHVNSQHSHLPESENPYKQRVSIQSVARNPVAGDGLYPSGVHHPSDGLYPGGGHRRSDGLPNEPSSHEPTNYAVRRPSHVRGTWPCIRVACHASSMQCARSGDRHTKSVPTLMTTLKSVPTLIHAFCSYGTLSFI